MIQTLPSFWSYLGEGVNSAINNAMALYLPKLICEKYPNHPYAQILCNQNQTQPEQTTLPISRNFNQVVNLPAGVQPSPQANVPVPTVFSPFASGSTVGTPALNPFLLSLLNRNMPIKAK